MDWSYGGRFVVVEERFLLHNTLILSTTIYIHFVKNSVTLLLDCFLPFISLSLHQVRFYFQAVFSYPPVNFDILG